MPRKSTASWEVTRDWMFKLGPRAFREFKQGQIVDGLTRECIASGKALQALKPATTQENDNDQANNV